MISARFRPALLLAAALAPTLARAQPARTWRIGLLNHTDPPGWMTEVKREFARRGFREGENTVFLERPGRRDTALTERSAKEMVDWQPDLIVAMVTTAALAAQRASKTIPIVFWSSEPVESGLVDGFRRVGANLTGVTLPIDVQLLPLRFLKEAIPTLTRVGTLYNPNYGPAPAQLRYLQDAARLFQIDVVVYPAVTAAEIEPAIARMAADGLRAMVVGQHELFNLNPKLVGGGALRHRIAAVTLYSTVLQEGAVACYSPDFSRIWPAVVEIGARILQGAPVASIPVDRKTAMRTMVNRRALRELGLSVSPALLEEADELVD